MAAEPRLTIIDEALLDAVSAQAVASPRRRMNHNFHTDNAHPAHRLLNAIEPNSYVVPHRHLDANKDESFIVLRGRLGLVVFDETGKVTSTHLLGPDCPAVGVDISHGTWHSAVSLESGTLFFEAKAGPYTTLSEAERAPWAPAENSPQAAAYQKELVQLFR